uniref:Variant surface glycoprotein 1125.156 n=1 Tax=Trypanosoma brucei TaxID=5691 RepID=A0A1J0R584_9TRYP|nr:variant surface glycoprotein 1125.156 [Trypanosoma brucei]
MLKQTVLTVLAITLTNASGPALKEEALEAICAVSERLRPITPKATQRLTTMTNRQDVYTNAALKLQVLASRTDDRNRTALFAAMASLAAKKAQQQTQTLTEAIPKLTLAVAQSELVRGQIHELVSFLHAAQTTGNTAGFCLAGHRGAHPQAAAKVNGCIVKSIENTPDPSPINDDFVDSSGFKGLTGFNDAKATSAGATSCIVFKDHTNAAATEVFQSTKNEAINLLGGLLKFSVTSSGNSPALTVENPSKIATANEAAPGKALSNAYNAIIKAKQHLRSLDLLTPEQAIVELTMSNELEAHLSAQLKRTATAKDESSSDKTAKEIINTIAQPVTDDGKTVWKLLDKEMVEGEEDKAKGKTKLSTLEDTEKLMEVLSYCTASRAVELKELEQRLKTAQATTKVVTKTLEEVCKEIKEKVPCNENPNCKYNDDKKEEPKCELSDKGKQAVKTNQETGVKDGKPECSKLLTQQTCEDANKDGKKHCGWRSGKDNENKKSKVKCRDSSFLVNKKISLMVSAYVSFAEV